VETGKQVANVSRMTFT